MNKDTKSHKQFFCKGEDLLSKEENEILDEYSRKLKALSEEYNKDLKNINSSWQTFPRKMFERTGGLQIMQEKLELICDSRWREFLSFLNLEPSRDLTFRL